MPKSRIAILLAPLLCLATVAGVACQSSASHSSSAPRVSQSTPQGSKAPTAGSSLARTGATGTARATKSSANSTASPGPFTATAHAASGFLTGIGDEQTEMFSNPYWQRLHTKIVRYIVPYDAAVRPYSLQEASVWIHDAEAAHQQILLSFYHSEYTPLKMPSVSTYQSDVQKFIKLFPHIRQYQPWDEANRGTIPHELVSPSPIQAAQYYQVLRRVCAGCQIVGLDVLDQQTTGRRCVTSKNSSARSTG